MTTFLQGLLAALVLASSVPAGLILARLCREEMKELRNGFAILISVSLILALAVLAYHRVDAALTLVFVAVVSTICFIQSRKI